MCIGRPGYLSQAARPASSFQQNISLIAFTTFVPTTFLTMLPSFRAPFVILVASAVAASAAPGLTLKSSTPNANVNGLENLKVTTTVTNTGDGTLKLLNDPRGVLNTFPENTFTVTNPSGSNPLFTGAKVSHPLLT